MQPLIFQMSVGHQGAMLLLSVLGMIHTLESHCRLILQLQKKPEDVHNSSGGIISDSNLVNLVPHNSARKSHKVQDENIIPTYLFKETENATRTISVKDEGDDELEKKQNCFLTKKLKDENTDASPNQKEGCVMPETQTS